MTNETVKGLLALIVVAGSLVGLFLVPAQVTVFVGLISTVLGYYFGRNQDQLVLGAKNFFKKK